MINKPSLLILLIFVLFVIKQNQALAQCDLGTGEVFNLIVFDGTTISNGSDVLGKVLMGGNVNITGYGVGTGFTSFQGDVFLVNGNLTFNTGQVNWGNVKATGSISGNFNVANGGTKTANTSLGVNFTTIRTELETRSTYWGTLASQNGTKTMTAGSTLILNANNSTGQVIFNLTNTELATAGEVQITNGASAQAILINVSGTTIDFKNKGLSVYPAQTKIVWNFPQATSIDISGIGVKGTVLAPYAAASFNNGHIDATPSPERRHLNKCNI